MIDEYIVDYGEYVGAGSGSFGYVNGACFANTFSVPHYLTFVQKGEWPILAKRDFSRKGACTLRFYDEAVRHFP